MEKLGHLRIRYILEDNKEFQEQVKKMVHQDNIVQWLLQDQLKQDQFNFIYDTGKIIYDSACRDKLLANDTTVIDSVLPRLLAYRSIMVIRNIQLKQACE